MMIYKVPNWMMERIYDSLSRGCVIRTISISKDGGGITGGSPVITPIHLRNNDYVGLQDFVDSLQDGFACV